MIRLTFILTAAIVATSLYLGQSPASATHGAIIVTELLNSAPHAEPSEF